jgi:hypothetical protein
MCDMLTPFTNRVGWPSSNDSLRLRPSVGWCGETAAEAASHAEPKAALVRLGQYALYAMLRPVHVVVNHLRLREPVPDATVEAAREGMQLVVDARALAARVAKIDDTHLILILEFSTAEDADRIAREVGAPSKLARPGCESTSARSSPAIRSAALAK